MNNEEKILQMLEQMQQEIGQVKQEQVKTNVRLDAMQEDITEIKEHAEVTREVTNALGKWAETVSVITKVGYPNP